MKYFYVFILLLALGNNHAAAQTTTTVTCGNLNFSAGSFSNWTGKYNNVTAPNGQGFYGSLTTNGLNSSPAGYNDMGFVHELCNGGADPNVPINRVAPGHVFSVRLGDDSAYKSSISGFMQYPYNHQTVSSTFSVTSVNQTITYWYAVVLDQSSASPHPANAQPYFTISLFDANNQEITCAHYAVSVTNASGFATQLDPTGQHEFYYKDWTSVIVALSDYMGQNVTVTFETSDCNAGGHFGYAYIAADCGMDTTVASTCLTTHIDMNTDANKLIVYPNPVNDVLNVELKMPNEPTELKLFDMSGKLVLQQIIENKTTINVSDLQKGVYTILLIGAKGVLNKKLILTGN